MKIQTCDCRYCETMLWQTQHLRATSLSPIGTSVRMILGNISCMSWPSSHCVRYISILRIQCKKNKNTKYFLKRILLLHWFCNVATLKYFPNSHKYEQESSSWIQSFKGLDCMEISGALCRTILWGHRFAVLRIFMMNCYTFTSLPHCLCNFHLAAFDFRRRHLQTQI